MVGKVAHRRGGGETAAVSCHQSLFPYLVYYCHAVPKVAVYDVELKERANGETINRGETSRFRPVHRRRSLRRGHVRGADCVDQGQKNERERRGK